jgi:hypothetical protein
MGIKDLWSQALGNIKKKDAVPFSTFKGRVVGIDVSIWLHKYCHTDTVALHLNSEPKYALTQSCWPYFKVIIVCWLMKELLLIIALMVFIIP